MLARAMLLWCLDRAQDLVRVMSGEPLVGKTRIQPLPDVALTFRQGWWGDLHPDDSAQLSGRWLSHAVVDSLLLFELLPVAPTLEVVLKTAPSGLQWGDAARTAGGIFVVEGRGPAGPTWLLWHEGATLLVTGKFASATPPRVVRRFLASAGRPSRT
jgi:hypothetical protein